MAQQCKICVHPNRDAIETAIRDKVSIRDIAGQYGLSRSSLSRHSNTHMIASIADQVEPVELPQEVVYEVIPGSQAAKLGSTEGGPGESAEGGGSAPETPSPPSVGLTAYQSTLGLKEKAERALQMAEKENDMAKMAFWFKELRSTLELIFKVGLAQKALEEKNHKDISPELQGKINAIIGG